jgi:putative Holliday junction resolvase
MSGTPETIIAFDYGTRRIGVAVGQQVTFSASPLTVVANIDGRPDWQKIESLIKEWKPDRLIVGMPANVDGTPADLGDVILAFIDDLGRFELPIEAVDERYTSVEVEAILRAQRAQGLKGRINKEMVDAGAAMLIAERWLKKEYQ